MTVHKLIFSFCRIGVIALVENAVLFQSGSSSSLFQHIIVQCITANSCASLRIAQCNLVIMRHCLLFTECVFDRCVML